MLSRERSIEVKYEARSIGMSRISRSSEQRGFVGESGWGRVVNHRNQSRYSNMKISYKTRSLIYESMGIALVGENGGAMGVRSGINKMKMETQ